MINYLIKKDNETKEIICFILDKKGYKFNPKLNENYLNVSNIIIIKPDLIDKILITKFNIKFKKLKFLVSLILDNNDDDSSEDYVYALEEIYLLRNIILNKYQGFLTPEKEMMLLNKLRHLENSLKSKILLSGSIKDLDDTKKTTRSR